MSFAKKICVGGWTFSGMENGNKGTIFNVLFFLIYCTVWQIGTFYKLKNKNQGKPFFKICQTDTWEIIKCHSYLNKNWQHRRRETSIGKVRDQNHASKDFPYDSTETKYGFWRRIEQVLMLFNFNIGDDSRENHGEPDGFWNQSIKSFHLRYKWCDDILLLYTVHIMGRLREDANSGKCGRKEEDDQQEGLNYSSNGCTFQRPEGKCWRWIILEKVYLM